MKDQKQPVDINGNIMFDLSDNNSDQYIPSILDIERLKCASIGDKVTSENDEWFVLRYKDGYTVYFNNHVNINNIVFKTVKDLIAYLNEC
jgi:hypothetical protein